MQKNRQQRSTTGDISLYGKIPPQAIDVEQTVLGSLLIDRGCVPVVMGMVSVETFYKQQNQVVFTACRKLYDKSQPVDILTVTEELTKSGELELVGGPYYIATLTDNVISGENSEFHCKILLEKQIKRSVIQSVSESITMAYDDTTDAFECVARLEHSLLNINNITATGGNLVPLSSILNEVEHLARNREELYKSGKCTGIPTGIVRMDKITTGWQPGELIILAGRPSMGKTALMIHHALKSGVHACIYSLEMSSVSLVNRMILSMADLDAGRFRAGAMSEDDWREFRVAKAKLNELPIYIDDNAVVTTRYIKSHSKMMRDRGLCDMIFVDYLQLADMRSDQSGRNREQEVSQAAREFKIIAKSLDIPVMLLSQLSRECEKRSDKRPMLSDLRESGAIEQDADIVIFAYRPSYYGLNSPSGDSQEGLGFEIIAKGRNIGTGEIPFSHNDSMTKIWDYANEGVQVQYKEGVPF